MLAYARLEQRRFDEIVSGLSDEVAIESKLQMDLCVARGEALMGLGLLKEAELIFDRVLDMGPHARALTNKARIAMILGDTIRSEEHTSELQSLMRISYAVFCLKKKNKIQLKRNK